MPKPTSNEALFLLAMVLGTTYGLIAGAPVADFLATVAVLGLALLVTAAVVVRVTGMDPRLGRGLVGVSLSFVVYAALTPLYSGLGERAIDAELRQLEVAVLGTTLVEVVAPYATPLLTDLFAFFYGLHAPLFFVSAILHWRAGRTERASRLLRTLGLAMYLGFLGYALFPAYGPVGGLVGLPPVGDNIGTRVVADHGVALSTFPSLHAGISAAVAIDAWRTSRRWGIAFTVVAVLIWSSTIYLRYHWVPDLVAGGLLAVFCTTVVDAVDSVRKRRRPPFVRPRKMVARPVLAMSDD